MDEPTRTGLLASLGASLGLPQAPAIFCRAARPSIRRSGATRTCQSSQTHRSMDRTQSHHVGKWQAKRETHGTASTACNGRAIVREPDRAKSAWSGTRGIILPLNDSGADWRQCNLSAAIAERHLLI